MKPINKLEWIRAYRLSCSLDFQYGLHIIGMVDRETFVRVTQVVINHKSATPHYREWIHAM